MGEIQRTFGWANTDLADATLTDTLAADSVSSFASSLSPGERHATKSDGDELSEPPDGAVRDSSGNKEALSPTPISQLRTGELVIDILQIRHNEIAELDFAHRFEIELEDFPDITLSELSEISPSFGANELAALLAAVELGRRVAESKAAPVRANRLSSSAVTKSFCLRYFQRLVQDGRQEEFHIITLNTKNVFLSSHQISVGTINASLVHPREVFRPAIKDSAASIIAVHNHPSGDPTPSQEDRSVTRRLEECGKTLGIDVLDHIVVARNGAVSLRET